MTNWTTDKIRKTFLDFFASKGHKILASDSVVPKNDPTVLFTTAGMQQFKLNFLGIDKSLKSAATSQKCLRTDDLDKVGKTDVHHTFFEMLGNFSFGDYFKKEAIVWAWEFLTKTLGIEEDRLWISVYKDDDEAAEIWLKEIRIPKDRLVRLGDHDNFWPADAKEKGPNGPCGPCSEIFYDYGPDMKAYDKNSNPGTDKEGRFAEIWNLVFTQFNRKDGGVLEPLPSKNIDTGMGLERLAAVMQGVKSNFDTDIFIPITNAILDECKAQNIPIEQPNLYLIADHARAITFAISDGVIPSNKGRGSVVKRLITDITDIIVFRGGKPFGSKIIREVVAAMKQPYPELEKSLSSIIDYVTQVENSYLENYKTLIPELKAETQKILKEGTHYEKIQQLGKVAFDFYDTRGLSLMTIALAMEKIGVSEKDFLSIKREFDERMKEQQERSRAASKMTGDVFAEAHLKLDIAKTEFLGYAHNESTSKVLRIFVGNDHKDKVTKGDKVKIILDKTPFYAEQGGQVGDTGILSGPSGKIRIEDTQKISDIYLHSGVVEEGSLKENDSVQTKIDVERRLDIMKNHTATHLLQAALREILGSHVKQQGSLVAPDRLRFDFTHPKAVTKEELNKIETAVNEIVKSATPVTTEILDIEEAKKKGALAFFAEKYGEKVRVVTVGNVSKEFCGGTHLKNTSEIENFKITSEGSVAQGIRRLEAKTGSGAVEFLNQLKSKEQELENSAKIKAQEAEQEKKRFADYLKSLDTKIDDMPVLAGTTIFSESISNVQVDTLKMISDSIKQKIKSSAVVIGTQSDNNATIVVALTDDLVKRGLNAGEIAKEIAPLMNGSGGGRPQLAQAGSKTCKDIEEVIKQANNIIRQRVEK